MIFAAARFADLPELRDLRAAFTERYGNSIDLYANKEVIIINGNSISLELSSFLFYFKRLNECMDCLQFVNKLKATPPTNDVKLQLMRDIAEEYGIEWTSKALEQKLYNNNILSVPGHAALVVSFLPNPCLHSFFYLYCMMGFLNLAF